MGFPGGSDGKESTCVEGGLSVIPWLGRFTGEGNGYLRRNGVAIMVNKTVEMQYLDAISKMTE